MSAILRIISPLQKVFRDEAPQAFSGVHAGFQNEVISFQLAFNGAGAISQRNSLAFLTVESPLSPIIRLRRVVHVPVGLATFDGADDNYLRKTSGLYPDLLTDLDKTGLRIYNDYWESVWIDVEPTADTVPGSYNVALILSDAEGAQFGRAEATIEILPGLLPAQELINTRWLHFDSIATYYGVEVWSERFWQITENFVKCAIERGINMIFTPIHTPPLDTLVGGERLTTQLIDVSLTNGKYSFGFDKLERWVNMCERLGAGYYEMAHLFTQWGARATPKIIANVDGEQKRIFGWDVAAQSDEYKAFLGAYLPALTAKLRELDVADRCYFHVSDEPSEEHLDDYAAAKALVEPYLEGFVIIDALSNLKFYQDGVIAKPIAANDHIHPFIDAGVKGLWAYYCLGQYRDVSNVFIAMPSARTRIFGVQCYKYDIEGILQWAFNFYGSQYSTYAINPYSSTDADGFGPSGDAFHVYPGPDGAPEESIRLMAMQQALEDHRALKWLESLTDKAFVMDLIEGELIEPIRFDRYPHEEAYLFYLRNRVNLEIVKRI